jgi:hypothetical protein
VTGLIVLAGGVVVPPGGGGTGGGGGAPGPAYVPESYLVTLTGTDGVVWDLNHGPVVLKTGAKLFDIPLINPYTQRSPGIPGVQWSGGYEVEEQTYTLPVLISGDSGEDWRSTNNAFWDSIFPGEITLTVSAPDATARSVTGVIISPGDQADDEDPLAFGRRLVNLAFLAPSPLWTGTPIEPKVITFGDEQPFIPSSGGPPFYVSPGSQTLATTITNPGKVEAWPRYIVGGPAPSWEVGVGSMTIASSLVPTGSNHIFIDSTPGVRTIVDGAGNRQQRNMSKVRWAPIPPGAEVPIVATVDNPGSGTYIEIDLVPQFWLPT